MSDTTVVAPDAATELVKTVNGMNPRALIKRSRALGEEFGKAGFELGLVLNNIRNGIKSKKAGFEKYASFRAFVETELPFSLATAERLANAFRVLTDHGVPLEPVAILPTSFIPVIVPALTAENHVERIAEASAPGMTFKKLNELPWVKAAKSKQHVDNGGSKGEGELHSSGPVTATKTTPAEAFEKYLKKNKPRDTLALLVKYHGDKPLTVLLKKAIDEAAKAAAAPAEPETPADSHSSDVSTNVIAALAKGQAFSQTGAAA